MVGIRSHIIRSLGPLGHRRLHGYSQTHVTSWREGDRDETYHREGQRPVRHSGHWALSTQEMKLNTLNVGLVAVEGLLEQLL
jgi:hypothetical protein